MSFLDIYKPNSFEEFSFDKDVVDYFKYKIKQNKYQLLIHGDNGVGKTSFINIFINKYIEYHKINDINYFKKNNIYKINNIEKININSLKNIIINFCKKSHYLHKKIIIIDDIDDYDDSTQNLFGKVIEKFKNNINFLFTCNQLQNIIPKIQSQVIKIELKKLSKNKLYNKIQNIINTEFKNYTNNNEIKNLDNIINKICNKNNYNITNILVQLQKFKLSNLKLNEENINNIIHIFSDETFFDITKIIIQYKNNNNINNNIINNNIINDNECKEQKTEFKTNLDNIYKIINNILNNGYSFLDFLEAYYFYIKNNFDNINNNNLFNITKSNDNIKNVDNNTIILNIIEKICFYIDKFYYYEYNENLIYFFIYDIISY